MVKREKRKGINNTPGAMADAKGSIGNFFCKKSIKPQNMTIKANSEYTEGCSNWALKLSVSVKTQPHQIWHEK